MTRKITVVLDFPVRYTGKEQKLACDILCKSFESEIECYREGDIQAYIIHEKVEKP
jgi:hypothetical protein